MKLKYIMITAMLLIGLDAVGQNKINWSGIEEAQQSNVVANKPIIVDFTAAWCGWCKKMDATTFQDQEVIDRMNEVFHPVKMDFESPTTFVFDGKEYTAKTLAKRMGVEGLPTMVVISSDLQSFDKLVGFKKSKDFLESIKSY